MNTVETKQTKQENTTDPATIVEAGQQLLHRWMKPKQIAAELGFSEANQAQMRMDKRIPYNRIGGYVLYDRIEINKWLESNKIDVVA